MAEDLVTEEFTGEQLTIFKRFLEENDVATDNIFRTFEENLSYYSKRLTSADYFSPGELFLTNSKFFPSNEMINNCALFQASIRWRTQTVHPSNSESALNEEKYKFTESLSSTLKDVVKFLDTHLTTELMACVDMYLIHKGATFQYLPEKNFVFKPQADSKQLGKSIESLLNITGEDTDHTVVLVPVFIPIRITTFLGEYGFRKSLVDYGRLLNVIESGFTDGTTTFSQINFDYVNSLFHVDGVEKNISDIVKVSVS
ncbi:MULTISPECIES: hypothetical protein [Lacticaseibacillus]|uniref:Uncharacterized protein n=3 Tax=Lacticaseibacillus TaxID=2759736 RepID=A0AAN1F137_LACCA|nr:MULTISPECIES: hypothetical protein [Lacticaseibacillus]ARY92878.1 hypothetical protein BGL52_14335 [Lacticaseibacillus casei]KAB1970096.1 hypothetical protein F9B82_06995 [Lacticaseibacillus casei]MDE3283880.1 hypothetical protein [Lacticaseibacillus casei]WLV78008.1 hypothetical protein LACPH_002792 [Lacticaseibacillus sp. NCIMB 15471]WLV80780.1 hypothetical protein LACSTY_002873 [Lacticaseibacillus sp. NCIMB 15473]